MATGDENPEIKQVVAEAATEALVENGVVSSEDAKEAAKALGKAGTGQERLLASAEARQKIVPLKSELPSVPPASAGTNPPNAPAQTPSSTDQNGQSPEKGGKEWSITGLVDSIMGGMVSFGDSISGFLKNAVSSISKWLGIKGDAAGDAAKKAAEKVKDAIEGLFPDAPIFDFGKMFEGAVVKPIVGDRKCIRPVHPVTHKKNVPHNGVDIELPKGVKVLASAAIPEGCKVIFSGENNGYGECVKFQLPDGNIGVMAHFSKRDVKVGDILKPGTVIGAIGSTGMSTGPHMHFEVRTPGGEVVDPEKYLPPELRA